MIYQKFPESPIADKTHNKMDEIVGLKAVALFFNQYNKKI